MQLLEIIQITSLHKRQGTPVDFAGSILVVAVYFHMGDLLRKIFPNMSAILKQIITYITIGIVFILMYKIDNEFFSNKV